jgi:hypothetical protein
MKWFLEIFEVFDRTLEITSIRKSLNELGGNLGALVTLQL